MSGSIFDAWDQRRSTTAPGLRVVSGGEGERFPAKAASLRPGHLIPPREWLYGTQLVRRYISVMVAPGGVGKTTLSLGMALSLAHGRGLLGEWVHQRVNALCCFLEDPEDEFDRRVAAGMIHHRLDDAELRGRVHLFNGRERRLTIAALDVDGVTVTYPDKEAVIAYIQENEIGAVFVDPFVNSHELDENSNPHINAAARAWAEIANTTGCAVMLVHHTRKGAVAGDMESGRGAAALRDAARVGLTLTAMSPEEAAESGIEEERRRLHVRLDDGKGNMAPAAGDAVWYRLVSVALGNGTPQYPKGDFVQAIERWQKPSAFKDLSAADLNEALDAIAAGPGQGQRYSLSNAGRGGGTRWAGRVLMERHGRNADQAKAMLDTWERNGLLVPDTYRDPVTRKEGTGCVRVVDAKRPSV